MSTPLTPCLYELLSGSQCFSSRLDPKFVPSHQGLGCTKWRCGVTEVCQSCDCPLPVLCFSETQRQSPSPQPRSPLRGRRHKVNLFASPLTQGVAISHIPVDLTTRIQRRPTRRDSWGPHGRILPQVGFGSETSPRQCPHPHLGERS